MYVQKGFISHNRRISNVPGVVAKIGELSSKGTTFSREKGFYTNNAIAPDLKLISFISKDGTTSIVAPEKIYRQVLELSDMVYKMSAGSIDSVTSQVVLENLITSFVGRGSDFRCGPIVIDEDLAMPEWVSWKSNADTAHPDNFIKIWFTDSAFIQQYDEFEIYVVPPFSVVDNFFQSGDLVEKALNAVTSTEHTERLQAAKEGYPETTIRTLTFNYIDPINSAHIVASNWGVLIYGVAGDNIDSIKDALMSYILERSEYLREEWIKILPDIFKRTEFILIPMWDRLAIPGRQLTVGVYSPQVKVTDALAKAKDVLPTYPQAHIDAHLTITAHPFKSITVLAIGGPDNRDNVYDLQQIFPDLIAVTSTSVDFNRMTARTQAWASMFAQMLSTAEIMGDFSTVPEGMMKMRRNGTLYLTKSYENINYLMAARLNFTTE
jgi:hypothetical protein